MFEEPFPKTRPSWLRSVRNRPLELDGYAAGKALAFEYQGLHHYQQTYRRSPERDLVQSANDRMKARLCWECGVTLIVIPDFTDSHNLSGCIDQIEHAVLWAGLNIPRKWRRPTELPELYSPLARVFGPGGWEDLQRFALEKGGRLVSASALNAMTPLLWRCARGHEWRLPARQVRIGTWCAQCARLSTWNTIEDMHALAVSKGGRYLSETYKGSKIAAKWECAEGHSWNATPAAVRQCTWCPVCAHAQRTATRRVRADQRDTA